MAKFDKFHICAQRRSSPPRHLRVGFTSVVETRSNSSRRGYGSRWQRARAAYLAQHPLCVMCERSGRITPADVVDHVVPHRGDQTLFWATGNWQPLCRRCHDSVKQRIEKSGREAGCDADGMPTDPAHHWRREG